jgi:hypothetical protein
VKAPAAAYFAAIDFDSAGVLDGPAAAVGTSRTIALGKGADAPKIVEMQLAREVTANKMSYACEFASVSHLVVSQPTIVSDAITNEDNPFSCVGYRADVTVYASSEDPNACFVTWIASWDSAAEGIEKMLPGLILKGMKDGEAKAAASAKL